LKNPHENKVGGGRLGGIDYFGVGNVWDGKSEGESHSRKVAEAAPTPWPTTSLTS
jgi:hypothetical protein